MLIDSHCHLDMIAKNNPDGGLEGVLERAEEAGVKHLITIAVDLPSSYATIDLAKKYQQISATVGIHPSDANAASCHEDEIIKLAKCSQAVAVGETGLDYYYNKSGLDVMREWFRKHIQIANEVKKPLIIHTRDAKEDTINIMQEENARNAGGVMHCFTESIEMAQQAMDLGFYISFSGIVTFKNAKNVQEVAKYVPLDRMLVETDAPYLAPVPHRGKPNEPAYVRYVAEYLAQLKGVSYEQLIETTGLNAHQLFSLS